MICFLAWLLTFSLSFAVFASSPLQYSCLENPMDGGSWKAAVHGVAKSRTRLSNFTFTFHFHALEEEMATHSSVLAWRIPGMAGPGGLLSMGSHGDGHDWSNLAAAAAGSHYILVLHGFPSKPHLAHENPLHSFGMSFTLISFWFWHLLSHFFGHVTP